MEDQWIIDSDFSFTLWIGGMFSLPLFCAGLVAVIYNGGQLGRTGPMLGRQNNLKAITRRIQF